MDGLSIPITVIVLYKVLAELALFSYHGFLP